MLSMIMINDTVKILQNDYIQQLSLETLLMAGVMWYFVLQLNGESSHLLQFKITFLRT